MVWSTSSEPRSFTKVRGSKRLTVEAGDRRAPGRDGEDLPGGSGDPRRDDLAGGPVAYRRLGDSRGG
jgi:hypothetical protein